jgi:hypothetical protein
VRLHADLVLDKGTARTSFVTAYSGGSFSLAFSAPCGTRFHTIIRAVGLKLDGFPTFSAAQCRARAERVLCHAGPFAAIPRSYSPWRVWVVKTSMLAAHIQVPLRFTGSSAGA